MNEIKNEYRCVTDPAEVKAYLGDSKIVSFDYETAPDEGYRNEDKAALDAAKSHICTLSLSVREHTGIMIPIAHKVGPNMPKAEFDALLVELLTDRSIIKVAHNLSFEAMFSYAKGIVKDDEGNLVIVPEEAEIVLRIYREYLEGASLFQIGQGLEADGIKTAAGSDYWLQSTLKKILTNEKYIGDALLQKTYTVDFLNKKRVANNGIVPQYYVENSHPAIIPREKFMKVREEMYRRAHMECGPDQKRRI